ncbi:MAG: CDP-alcohol phosphatidyltransferase family protein, partial [Acutalibacter sp.]|nr:CDP-alcohol phosphatidyltransferase family protein [Acutalibacter sp.]
MNLPNQLTLLRVAMVPVFMVFAALTKFGTEEFSRLMCGLAGVLFALASLTDLLDGKIARKYHLETDFGKFADPLADKMLTTAAFIY